MQQDTSTTVPPSQQPASTARFLWLIAGAVVLPCLPSLWLDSCLRSRLLSRVITTANPSADLSVPGAASPALQQNPYGLACDIAPQAWELIVRNLLLAAIFFALGYLTRKAVRARPLLAAAALGGIGMTVQVALTLFAYPDPFFFAVETVDALGADLIHSLRIANVRTWLTSCLIATTISLAGAWYAAWRHRRVAAVAAPW